MTSLPAWTHRVHHDGSAAYVSNPLPAHGDTVTLRLRVPRDAPAERIFIRSMLDGEFSMRPMNIAVSSDRADYWEGTLPIHQPRTDYCFKLMTPQGAYFYAADGIRQADTPDFFDFTILADYNAPLWVREAVFYQIFPERFHNGDPSNDVVDGEYSRRGFSAIQREWGELPYPWEKAGSMDFFGGDLQGITQKLDYIADLGINALYLTPIFTAESNHKYDIVDYRHVDPHFGGEEALIALREATAERDMRLMLDVTPNHCSFNHEWIKAVKADPNVPEREFVYYDEDNDSFELWLGVPSLIKLNYSSAALRDEMYRGENAILKQWLQPPYNADAWRLDVANMTGNLGMEQLDHEVWREMRESLKAVAPDVYLLGEYFQDGTPHLQGDELDASMNYQGFNIPLRRWLGGEDIAGHDNQPYADPHPLATSAMAQQWQHFLAAVPYPIALQQFNQLDSHDTTRFLRVVGDDKALLKLGATLMFGFPGVPCLYYGDEIGMTGGKDPDNRRCMMWDEADWDSDLRTFFQRLIDVRKTSPALQHGGFQVLHAADDLVAYLREAPDQTMLVVGYRGADSLAAEIDVSQADLTDGVTLADTLSEATFTVTGERLALGTLEAGTALILEAR